MALQACSLVIAHVEAKEQQVGPTQDDDPAVGVWTMLDFLATGFLDVS